MSATIEAPVRTLSASLPETSDPAYEAAVRGADFLDRELGPNWEDRIDEETLDLSEPCKCVIGQTHGGSDGYMRFVDDLSLRFLITHGFVYGRVRYPALTAAWLRVLGERKQARG